MTGHGLRFALRQGWIDTPPPNPIRRPTSQHLSHEHKTAATAAWGVFRGEQQTRIIS
jgi:hypothetical protein